MYDFSLYSWTPFGIPKGINFTFNIIDYDPRIVASNIHASLILIMSQWGKVIKVLKCGTLHLVL